MCISNFVADEQWDSATAVPWSPAKNENGIDEQSETTKKPIIFKFKNELTFIYYLTTNN